MLVCFLKLPPGVSPALMKTGSGVMGFGLGYQGFTKPSIIILEGIIMLEGWISSTVVDLCLGLGVLESTG